MLRRCSAVTKLKLRPMKKILTPLTSFLDDSAGSEQDIVLLSSAAWQYVRNVSGIPFLK